MKNEAGISLIEIIIALGLLGLISLAFLSSMSGASTAYFTADERSTAESLARREMEYIKKENYQAVNPASPWSYELPTTPPTWDPSHTIPGGYTGYRVNVAAQLPPSHFYDQGIQIITVAVYHNAADPVVTLEGYKVNR